MGEKRDRRGTIAARRLLGTVAPRLGVQVSSSVAFPVGANRCSSQRLRAMGSVTSKSTTLVSLFSVLCISHTSKSDTSQFVLDFFSLSSNIKLIECCKGGAFESGQ